MPFRKYADYTTQWLLNLVKFYTAKGEQSPLGLSMELQRRGLLA
jgi:hypothetical protein